MKRKKWSILYNALQHYFKEDNTAYASHMTLSCLLALFPFLSFAASLASFLGAAKYAQKSADYIFSMLPYALAAPLTNELIKILTTQRSSILTLSVITTAYFASNGIEALRTALNRAFRVKDQRSLIFCRLQSLLFVLLGTIGFIFINFLLILQPLFSEIMENTLPNFLHYTDFIGLWRYFIAIFILSITILTLYKWLPAEKRKLKDILPGAIFTLCAWFVASLIFAYYLRYFFSNYVTTYSGLASVMVAIIYLYMLSSIFIFGGQINAARKLYS